MSLPCFLFPFFLSFFACGRRANKKPVLRNRGRTSDPWYHLSLSHPHRCDLIGHKHALARWRALPYVPDTTCFRQSARGMYSLHTTSPSRTNRRLSAGAAYGTTCFRSSLYADIIAPFFRFVNRKNKKTQKFFYCCLKWKSCEKKGKTYESPLHFLEI